VPSCGLDAQSGATIGASIRFGNAGSGNHTLRDERDFAHHVDYIHFNPVKHGLVSRVPDWPHSSFHRYVRRGSLPADWGGLGEESAGEFGE